MLLTYGYAVTPDDWELNEENSTGYVRIYYVDSSDAIYQDYTKTVSFQHNHLYLLPDSIPYHAWRTNTGEFCCTYVHAALSPLTLTSLISMQVEPDTFLFHLLQSLYYAVKGSEDPEVVEKLIDALSQYLIAKGVLPEMDKGIQPLLEYIREHLSEELTVEGLSEMMHFHPNAFIRYFHKKTGLPPHRYIRNLRMQKAAQLLFQTDETVRSVAEKVGYTDFSSFCRAYKSFWGVQPKKNLPFVP